jgi:hypothetical protein
MRNDKELKPKIKSRKLNRKMMKSTVGGKEFYARKALGPDDLIWIGGV